MNYGENWDELRKECYTRDNYTCRKCNKKLILPHAHHIIPLKKGGLNTLKNLMTVCAKCHKKLDNQYLRVGKTNHVKRELRKNEGLNE